MQRTVMEAKRLGVYICHPESTIREAMCQMVARDVSALVVVDKRGYLQGIISRTDLLRSYVTDSHWQSTPVSAVMSADVVTVSPDATMDTVARLLLQDHIHRVVVVQREPDGGLKPISVVSDSDFVYHMSKDTGTP